ncbi:hypothetical protein ACHWQZ_G003619 [Mnemiopsis leidyi]
MVPEEYAVIFLALLSAFNGALSSSGYLGNCRWRAILTGDLLRRQDNVSGVQSCQDLCVEEDDCFVYTYLGNLIKHPGACFLRGRGYGPLRGYNHELVLKSGAITGILNCLESVSCMRDDVIFNNGYIGKLEYIPTLEKCFAACSANVACVLFSYYPDDRLCFLRDETAVSVHKTHSIRVVSALISCLAATASAQGDDALSSELERTDTDSTLGSSYRADSAEVEAKTLHDPEVSLLGELSEISEAGNQPHFLGIQADKVKSGKDRMNRWNSSFRRISNVKGKSAWRPTVRRKSYNKIKPMFKEKLTEKEESRDNSVIRTPECTLNLPEDKASTLDFPISLGSEAVVYCKSELRKNAVIKCDKARSIAIEELPECKRSYVLNSGHCGVYPPKGILTFPNSPVVPVGGSLVATCLGNKDKPTIIPCTIANPITRSDYPSC